jgi:hypothetical protein
MTLIRMTRTRWIVAAAAVAFGISSVAYAAGGSDDERPGPGAVAAVVADTGGPGGGAVAGRAQGAVADAERALGAHVELRVPRSPTEQRSALIGLAAGGADVIVGVGLDTPGTLARLADRKPGTRIVNVPAGATDLDGAIAAAVTGAR